MSSIKVYFVNGKVLYINNKVITTSDSLYDNFNFQIFTDIHGQTDIFEMVCKAVIDEIYGGGSYDVTDLSFSTGDIVASNTNTCSSGNYMYQKGLKEIRGVIDSQFNSNAIFIPVMGNHETTDLVDYTGKNQMPHMYSEFSLICDKDLFSNNTWSYFASGLRPSDQSGKKWNVDYDYDESAWTTDGEKIIGDGNNILDNTCTYGLFDGDYTYSINTQISGTELATGNNAIYFRKKISISEAVYNSMKGVEVTILFKDSYVMFINGELASYDNINPYLSGSDPTTLPSDIGAWEELKKESYTTHPDNVTSSFLISKDFFQVGDNLISIEIHRHPDNTGTDYSMYMGCRMKYGDDTSRESIGELFFDGYDDPSYSGDEDMFLNSTNYAFEYNGILFVVLNCAQTGSSEDDVSYSLQSIDPSVYMWLCNILKNNNKPVFVFSHFSLTRSAGTPLVNAYGHQSNYYGGANGDLYDLLVSHNAIVAFCAGHEHVYKKYNISDSSDYIDKTALSITHIDGNLPATVIVAGDDSDYAGAYYLYSTIGSGTDKYVIYNKFGTSYYIVSSSSTGKFYLTTSYSDPTSVKYFEKTYGTGLVGTYSNPVSPYDSMTVSLGDSLLQIVNSPSGGAPRIYYSNGLGADESLATGYSFMNVYVNHDSQSFTFKRYKNTQPRASSSAPSSSYWELDDIFSVPFPTSVNNNLDCSDNNTYTLNVDAVAYIDYIDDVHSNAIAIPITSSIPDDTYGGTTDYSKTNISSGTKIKLSCPSFRQVTIGESNYYVSMYRWKLKIYDSSLPLGYKITYRTGIIYNDFYPVLGTTVIDTSVVFTMYSNVDATIEYIYGNPYVTTTPTPTTTATPYYYFASFLFEELSEEEINILYDKYKNNLEILPKEEQEDYLINLVEKGEISADEAISLALKLGIE